MFGGLAKGTLWVVGVAALVLVVLTGGQGLTDLPTARRGWRNLLLIVLSVVVVVGIVIAFATLNDKYLHRI